MKKKGVNFISTFVFVFQLKCCGMNTTGLPQPWMAWKFNHRVNPDPSDETVPASCCRPEFYPDCSLENPAKEDQIWAKDCFAEGLEFVRGHAVYLFVAALVIALLMTLGIVFAFLLFILIE